MQQVFNIILSKDNIYDITLTEEKQESELKPFSLTGDSFPKIVVRHDIGKRFYDDNGVLNISMIDFLLDSDVV